MRRSGQVVLLVLTVAVLWGLSGSVLFTERSPRVEVGVGTTPGEDPWVERATRVAGERMEEWYLEMTAWADEQEQVYSEEGEPIPFDASIFFKWKYKELLAMDDPGTSDEQYPAGSEDTRKWDGYTKTNTGTHCDIYVETGSNSFNSLKNEFESVIWPSDIEAFGNPGFKIDIYVYYRDGSSPESDGAGGVGGFFTPSRSKRVYIDSADISGWGFEILAHEFQHLIHNNKDPYEHLWIDEGCADYAIVKAYGQNAGGVRTHLQYFEAYPDNDLTQFDNQPYDYGSTAAYITYLVDHYGGDDFVKSLVSNSGRGFSGVSSTLSQKGYSDDSIDAYLNWLVANYLDDSDIYEGEFGYSNLNIKVNLEESYSSYPMSDTSEVNSWGADYYRFQNGREGLGIEFTGKGGGNDFAAWVVKLGSSGTTAELMDLDSSDYGLYPLGGFGTDFTTVLLIVTCDDGAEYDFSLGNMDTTPPVTLLSADPAAPDGDNGYYVTNPVITLSTEAGARTYFYLNGDDEEPKSYTSSFAVPEGTNTVHYYSVDASSNREITLTRDFMVDTEPPLADLTIKPDSPDSPAFNGWYVTVPTIKLSSSEDGNIYYRWDEEKAEKYSGEVDVPEGEHELDYWSLDMAGNKGEVESFDVKLDTMTPYTIINLTPSNPHFGNDGWYNETVHVELFPNEAAESYYSWDGDHYQFYSNPVKAPEGAHILYFYSVDEAGNQEGIEEMLIKVDTESARSEMSIHPEEPDGDNGYYVTLPEIYLTCADEDGILYYFWDDGHPDDYDPLTSEITVPEGTHTFSYYSVDRANNREEIRSIELSVDLHSPITDLHKMPREPDGNDEWYHNISITFDSVSDDLGKTYYFTDLSSKERTFSGPLGPEDFENGERTLFYYSVDTAGNREITRSFTFRLDNEPPRAVPLVSSSEIVEGDEITIFAAASRDNVAIKEFQYVFGDGTQTNWMSENSVNHTYDSSGTYTVHLRVRDTSGLESDVSQIRITVKPKEDGDRMIPFLPAGASFQYGGLAAIAVILFILLVVVIAVIKRRKGKDKDGNATLPEEELEEDQSAIEEAKRLYGKQTFTSKAGKEEDTVGGDEGKKEALYQEREETQVRYYEDLYGTANGWSPSEKEEVEYPELTSGSDNYGEIEYLPPGPDASEGFALTSRDEAGDDTYGNGPWEPAGADEDERYMDFVDDRDFDVDIEPDAVSETYLYDESDEETDIYWGEEEEMVEGDGDRSELDSWKL